ncbi:tetratricopeptide repeat protein [Tsuneonella sp. HG222]
MTLAILPALGGCSSVFGRDLSNLFRPRTPAQDVDVTVAAVVPVTETGRQQLAAGNPGLAAETFQKALANGEAIGPAANGLGIAYARMGRPDLAKRFFEQALAASPENAMFAANLERLVDANRLALAAQDARAAIKAASALDREGRIETATASVTTPAAPAPAAKAMRRISRTEVAIVTSPSNGPSTSGQRTAVVTARPRTFEPIVRLQIGRDNIADFKPVVTIPLPSARAAAPVARPVQVARRAGAAS